MSQINPDDEATSPFHIGEQQIQSRVHMREQMETFGKQVIRSYMPDQHREFFKQLNYLVVGSVDEHGWPWASILPGKTGFISSPDATSLSINSMAIQGDPLKNSIKKDAALGLLGIDLATRRRNRLNARITHIDDERFSLSVDQSFGNCPQYIQTRTIEIDNDVDSRRQSHQQEDQQDPHKFAFSVLDDTHRDLISNADTFFVSSFVETQDRPDIQGVDVSHRGGQPGFVKVDANTLTIPDYSGNNHFNTLGNFLVNPKAGLIFADFESGDLLMLTGRVEILWENAPEVIAFKGAQRAWRFKLDHGLWLKQALPFRFRFIDYSPNSLLAGNWEQATATLAALKNRNAWRNYRVSHVEDESSVIRSFYFKPADGDGLLPFKAGQFFTLRIQPGNCDKPIIRTYTVSSAPGDDFYRISVKREDRGQISRHLHDRLKTGDIIQAKAPSGDFHIDAEQTRPAVLIAGGVGITPMISMAQHISNEGQRTRHTRPLTIMHAARTIDQRAFASAFQKLEKISGGIIRYFSFISRPEKNDKPGIDFNAAGHINDDALRQILALDDYDFYVCGPDTFMQSLYDGLRRLGVKDTRIFAEAFGPASLRRQADENQTSDNSLEAEQAIIKFTESGFEHPWNCGDATLLEVAESHGLNPEFGCRNGVCGTCVTKLVSGSVAYRTKPSMPHENDEVLICCAVPAKDTDALELAL